jgi:Fe-S cluster biosynthesis and repair protein YggX
MLISVIIIADEQFDRRGASLGTQWNGNSLSKIDQPNAEIESLPSEEFTEIFRELSKKDWERWDKEIETDSQAGKLDFQMREAREEKVKRTLQDL